MTTTHIHTTTKRHRFAAGALLGAAAAMTWISLTAAPVANATQQEDAYYNCAGQSGGNNKMCCDLTGGAWHPGKPPFSDGGRCIFPLMGPTSPNDSGPTGGMPPVNTAPKLGTPQSGTRG